MVLRGFPIVFAAGLLLFCGCEYAPIPEETLVKTAWFQKQLELVHENNNGTISGLLAEQRIIVGKITMILFWSAGKLCFIKIPSVFPMPKLPQKSMSESGLPHGFNVIPKAAHRWFLSTGN